MGWKDDWNKLVRFRIIVIKIVDALVWLLSKLRKILA